MNLSAAGGGRLDVLYRPGLARRLLPWTAPFLVYAFANREQSHLHTVIAFLIGTGLVVLVARRPFRSLEVLLLLLPFSRFILSLAYRLGLPSAVVRGAGFWKEGILAGLAVAAYRNWRASKPPLTAVDKVVLGYVFLGLAYLLFPATLVGSAVGAHLSFYSREFGWRSDVLYFGVFLVCRHLGLSIQQIQALLMRTLQMGIILALIGIYEFIFPSAFNHFIVKVIQLPQYEVGILHTTSTGSFVLYSSSHVPRVGSLLDYLTVGWYFILALGFALELISRNRARWWLPWAIPLLGVSIVLTQSRDAIIGGVVATLVALRSQIGRSIVRRVRLSSFLLLLAVVGLPVMIFAGLGHRFVSSSSSNQGHNGGVRQGLQVMQAYPLGRGLSTGSGGGQLASAKGLVSPTDLFVPEDEWLQIGTQLGYFGLLLYGTGAVLMVSRLRPRRPDATPDAASAASGVRNAMVGILVGALFLQPFVEPVVSWTVFALCGLGTAALDFPRVDRGGGSRMAELTWGFRGAQTKVALGSTIRQRLA